MALSLSGGQRLDVQQGPRAAWGGPDGRRHPQALHNSLTLPAWFFPAMILQAWARDVTFSLEYVGEEERGGIPVWHVRGSQRPVGQSDEFTASLLLRASAMDLYIDTGTSLPVALEFNIHPDGDALRDFPVRVEYRDFQEAESGVKAPFHVQRFLQNTLLLDLTISSAAFNSGLLGSDFDVQ